MSELFKSISLKKSLEYNLIPPTVNRYNAPVAALPVQEFRKLILTFLSIELKNLIEKEGLSWTGEICKESKDLNNFTIIKKCSVSINTYITPNLFESSSCVVIDFTPSGNEFIFREFFQRFKNYVLGNELALKPHDLVELQRLCITNDYTTIKNNSDLMNSKYFGF
jgi:hypothetical protein